MEERELTLVAIVVGSLVGVLLVSACTFYWSVLPCVPAGA
jgi:hypothetical protein